MKTPKISESCPKGHKDIDSIEKKPGSVYQGKRYCFCYTCEKKYFDEDY